MRPGVHTISGTTIVPTYRQGVPELAHLAGRLGVSTSSGTRGRLPAVGSGSATMTRMTAHAMA